LLESIGDVVPQRGSCFDDVKFDALGGEHGVFIGGSEVTKITVPHSDGFGVIPKLTTYTRVHHSTGESEQVLQIEQFPASLSEYIERMTLCNILFGDDWQLHSFIHWSDGKLSAVTKQPVYMGAEATLKELEDGFQEMGWFMMKATKLDGGCHTMFYNAVYEVAAYDLNSRNCYIDKGVLQPLDVILFKPDEDMLEFFGYYG